MTKLKLLILSFFCIHSFAHADTNTNSNFYPYSDMKDVKLDKNIQILEISIENKKVASKSVTLVAILSNPTSHILYIMDKEIYQKRGQVQLTIQNDSRNCACPRFPHYHVCGHEVGRCLDLSSVDVVDDQQFDYGPWPSEFKDDGISATNQTGLMSNHSGPETAWIRHEDCQETNGYGTYSQYLH